MANSVGLDEVAQDLHCLQIPLFLSLILKELTLKTAKMKVLEFANNVDPYECAYHKPYLHLHFLPCNLSAPDKKG